MPDRRVTPPYPFSAVVGLDDLRLALVLNAVSPAIGGVLARGEKGTAKSTVVRALHALLPSVTVVTGCRFSCDPATPDPGCPDGPHETPPDPVTETRAARLVELPVGATEDRLTGSLDLERALTAGVRAYQPGLLAAAHRGVLYVDEVNLLADHLVDTLLDAAGMGRAYVERDGVSIRHAARFLLVGTMNPEEGELRPQLLDRFGLTVEVAASREPVERAEVVRRRLAYEADPVGFAAGWAAEDASLARRIVTARDRLSRVELTDAALTRIAAVCAAFDVDGMRADLVTARTAVALAAWNDRDRVNDDDIRRAAELALPHRRRRNPFDAPGIDPDQLDQALDRARDEHPDDDPDDPGGAARGSTDNDNDHGDVEPRATDGPDAEPPTTAREDTTPEAGSPRVPGTPGSEPASEQAAVAASAPYRTRLLTVPGVGRPRGDVVGRRSPAESSRGRLVRARRPENRLTDLHLTATLLAAAPHQRARSLKPPGGPGRPRASHELRGDGVQGPGGSDRSEASRKLVLERGDLREAVRRGREANTVLFCVDASGSMAARARMAAVKGAVLSLLLDAYQRRDTVGLITFRRDEATVVLPPTGSVDVAARRLDGLPTGGRTPLAAGLLKAGEVVRTVRRRDPGRRALLVVVTDGRATQGTDPVGEARRAAAMLAADRVASVVVDCESGHVRLGLARELATHLGGVHLPLAELSASGLVETVQFVSRRVA